MRDINIPRYIRTVLTEQELLELRSANQTVDSEKRQLALKSFFHTKPIFEKIQEDVDPTWLSYEIFISGRHYEF